MDMRYDIQSLGSNKLSFQLDEVITSFDAVLTHPWTLEEKTAVLTPVESYILDFYGVPYEQENLAGGQIYMVGGTWDVKLYQSGKPKSNENCLLNIKLQVEKNEIMIASGTISSADILQFNTTPYELIAAPGANKVILLKSALFEFVAGTAYSNDTVNFKIGTLSLDTTAYLAGGNETILPVLDIGFAGLPGASLANTSVTLTTAADPTGGTGTIKYYIEYDIVNLSNL